MHRHRHGNGFTLVELLVVIAIISVLAGLLLPALEGALAQARLIRCGSNLRQVGLGTRMYIDDFGDCLYQDNLYYLTHGSSRPNDLHYSFAGVLEQDYIQDPQVLFCPAAEGWEGDHPTRKMGFYPKLMWSYWEGRSGLPSMSSYSFSHYRRYAVQGRVALTLAEFQDEWGEYPYLTDFVCQFSWHDMKASGLYCDGHVEAGPIPRLHDYILTVSEGRLDSWIFLFWDALYTDVEEEW